MSLISPMTGWPGVPAKQERDGEDRRRASTRRTRLSEAFSRAGPWERLGSSWVCLADGEILPWSLKAGFLLYENAPRIASAVRASLDEVACADQRRLPRVLQDLLTARANAVGNSKKSDSAIRRLRKSRRAVCAVSGARCRGWNVHLVIASLASRSGSKCSKARWLEPTFALAPYEAVSSNDDDGAR